MKNMKWMAVVLALVSFCLWIPSVAANPPKVKTPQFHADTKVKFDAVATEVRKQMLKDGRFSFVTDAEYKTITANLDAMDELFTKYGDVDQMHKDNKIALFNHQEVVNSILRQRDNDRLICDSEAPTGSHIHITKCRTYGDIQKNQRETKDFLRDHWAVQQLRGGN